MVFTSHVKTSKTNLHLLPAARLISLLYWKRCRKEIKVTANQINYQRQREEARNNRANNLIGMATIRETERANRAQEYLTGQSQRESARHNRATENYSLKALSETNRSNLAKEMEANRHNVATERITSEYNAAQLQNQRNVLSETIRANQAREAETNRSNLANELQTQSRDYATYAINSRNADTNEKRLRNDREIAELQSKTSKTNTARKIMGDFVSSAIRSMSGLASSFIR